MDWLAFILSVVAGLYIGHILNRLQESYKALQEILAAKMDRTPVEDKKSDILDPYEVERDTKREHEELMRRLNS